jgi:hypothetical protein
MAKFICTKHAALANKIALYWQNQNQRQVKAEEWFMAALALGSALEAMLYAYFIIWSGDGNSEPAKDGEIPANWVLDDLITAAKQVDLLTSVKFKDEFGEHAVESVIDEIRHMRNNLHAGVALKKDFDPAKFTKQEYERLNKIFIAVLDNWERHL